MRKLIILLMFLGSSAIAQDAPSFLERLFGTDTAETDTEQGTMLERLIEDSLSGAGRSVKVTGFRGALSGKATLERLTISDADGDWFTLIDATLDWNRGALFRRRLEVTELSATEVLMPRLAQSTESGAPTPESGRFQLPELPVSVEIGQFSIERVELGEPVIGVAAVISSEGTISLANGDGSVDLDITRLDRPGEVSLDAGFQNSSGDLRLDLTMSEPEGGILATLAGLPGSPSVDFSVKGEAPISDFAADIMLATDGEERLAGQVVISETEEAQRIAANIEGDIAPVFAPQYRNFFGNALSLSAEALLFDDGKVALPAFSLIAREVFLEGSANINADRLPERIDIVGRIAPEVGDTVLLPFAGGTNQIARANLSIQFDAAQSDDWQFGFRILELENEGLSLDETRVTGTGRIRGGVSPQISSAIDFDITGLKTTSGIDEALGENLQGNARIDWSGGPIAVERFAFSGADVSADGDASIEGGTISATAAMSANRVANFSKLLGRSLSGRADLNLEGTFTLLTQSFDVSAQGQTVDLTIDDPRADAVLAGTARLEVDAVRDTDGLRIALQTLESETAQLTGEASLRSGGSSASINGMLRETSLVIPGLTGPSEIQFSGQESETRDWTIATRLEAPSITAKIDGLLSNIYEFPAFQGQADIESSDISVLSEATGRELAGQVRLTANGGLNADLSRALVDGTVTGRDLSIGDDRIDPLLVGPVTLKLEGGRTEDRLDIVQLVINGKTLDAELAGIVTELSGTPIFEGSVTAASSDLSVLSNLAGRPLSGTLNFTAQGGAKADLSEAIIEATANGQSITVGIPDADRLLRGPVNLAIDAGRQDNRFNISEFAFESGALTVTTSGALGNSGEQLNIQARLAEIAPYVPGFNGSASVDGTVAQNGGGIYLELDAIGPGGTLASISGQVAPDISTVNLSVNGTAPLALANRFIAPRSLAGSTRFELDVIGTPTLENVSGDLTVADARLAAPILRAALEDITGRVTLSGGRASLDLNSRLQTGGRVTVNGPVGLAFPNAADLQVDLIAARLTDPKLFETLIDGRISVNGPLSGGASVTGALNLGETNIRIPNSSIGGSGAIPEVTHINEPPPVRRTRRKAGLLETASSSETTSTRGFPLDIILSSPNRLFVRGRGLDSEFGGGLRITGTTSNVVPIGAFELIRGRLDILGRRLALDEARITVQGDLIPFLDIRASTNADGTQVSVEVFGPADNPEIRFTSSPELPQEEVIARLIFGRGLDKLSPLQAARLALAVRTLAGQGGEGVVGDIRRGAGLADFDVTTTEDGNTALRAGAYLSENVYSDVTVDSAGETQLNLNLDISPSLTVRGGLKDEGETSLGIFFERDY